MSASILIFTWGNPSRGDDAIGPYIYDILCKESLPDVDILTDFQLQIEHILDLENRQCVLFVDASVSAQTPFEFYPLHAAQEISYTTHAMSPQSLLAVYQKVNNRDAPNSYMLSIRGYRFILGQEISNRASKNIKKAIQLIRKEIFRM